MNEQFLCTAKYSFKTLFDLFIIEMFNHKKKNVIKTLK